MAWYKLDEEGNIEGLLKPLAPLINYVARLDGEGKYWQLKDPIVIPSNADFKIRTEFYAETDSSMIAASVTHRPFLYVRSDGKAVFEPEDGVFIPTQQSVVGRDIDLLIELSGSQLSISEVGADNTNTKTVSNLGSISITTLGARLESLYLSGYVKSINVEVDGITTHSIPLTNKAQGAYQVATSTPLGANLYTQEIIENPAYAHEKWSYLGAGRWKLNGSGSATPLQFLATPAQPQKGYVQFEIESIEGGSLTCTNEFLDSGYFSTPGVKTFYYENLQDVVSILLKRRSGTVQAIIKNIKHYDAEGVLVAEMVGYTPDVWEQI